MDSEKKYFMIYQQGKEITDQFCLDDDFNVPDTKRDVQRIIMTEGNIQIDELKCVENYIRVIGKMLFKVLYVTDEGETKITSLEGKIPFEEMVYADEEVLDNVFAKEADINLSVNVIHSRKLNLKAVVDLKIASDGQQEAELLTDVSDSTNLYKKYEENSFLKLFTVKRDTYRIKEEVSLGGTRETIGTLLWSNVISRKLDTRICPDEIHLQGELMFFGFYESVDGKVDWIEQMIPYQGKISCYGAKDSMYHQIYPQLRDVTIDVRMDEDGEMRIFGVEATLEVRLVIYEEEKIQILGDMYSLEKQCDIVCQEMKMEQLLMQNHSKCKVTEKLSLPEIKDDILQICHSSAQAQIDQVEVEDRGLRVEGSLHVNFLYVKPNDEIPFDVWQGMVPFSCQVECNGICQDVDYELLGCVEQISIGLLGNGEIEVKAVLAIRSFMKRPIIIQTIGEIQMHPVNYRDQERVPGIIGYIVKDEDTLWNLAKKYSTTVESIREINNLEKTQLKSGQKILIFRENMSIL